MNDIELDRDILEEIEYLSSVGNDYFDNSDLTMAIGSYNKALELLPDPKHSWEQATWLFSSIGDAYWELRKFEASYDAFFNALKCPGGIGNPFIHLRVGQLQTEFGNSEKARDELIRAYMGAGEDIFQDQNPKYLAKISDLIQEENT